MLAREDSECMMKQRIFDERTFEERVNYGIDAYQMIRPGDTVIAAVSGGVDSVCLLLLLAARAAREATIFPPDPGEMAVGEASIRQGSGEAAPFRLQAVHVEHGIRGEESEADARFVEALCESLQIPVRIIRVDAAAYATGRGLSWKRQPGSSATKPLSALRGSCIAKPLSMSRGRRGRSRSFRAQGRTGIERART